MVSESRKVFIASENPRSLVRFLGDHFKIVEQPSEADFIVVDCDRPLLPSLWMRHPKAVIVPDLVPVAPVFLAALSGESSEGFIKRLRDYFPGDLDLFPVYRTGQDLANALRWLQSIIPFHTRNVSLPEEITKFAVSLLRSTDAANLGQTS